MRPLIVALVFAAPALADEPVTIKLRLHAQPGKTVTTTSKHVDSGSTRLEDADGKQLLEIKPGGSETVTRTTVLEADKDGVPTKYLRSYEKATEKENGKEKTLSYQGRTLLFEKGKDGKFRVGAAGKGDLEPADAEKLVDRANKPNETEAILKQFAPRKPVKVGDSWPLDIKLIAPILDGKVDEKKSTATAKLAKVETRGKAPVGTFELDVKLALTSTSGKIDMTFDPPATATIKGTVELVIDGSSTEAKSDVVMSMKGAGKWSAPGGAAGKIVFDVTGKVTDFETAERADKDAAKVPAVAWLRAAGEWGPFKPKDGSFQVDLPSAPKEETKKNDRGDKTVTWTAEAGAGTVAYVVAITEFAGADPAAIDPKAVLDAVANSQKNAQNLKDIKQDGFPGIAFDRADTVGGKDVEFHQRVVVANGRLFQQIVISEKGKGKAAETDKFIKSFKITARPKDD